METSRARIVRGNDRAIHHNSFRTAIPHSAQERQVSRAGKREREREREIDRHAYYYKLVTSGTRLFRTRGISNSAFRSEALGAFPKTLDFIYFHS